MLREHRASTDFEAWEHVNRLVQESSGAGFEVILAILAATDDAEVLANLAAGPLEDLLSLHGPDSIGAVEDTARVDARFRQLLWGIWPGRMAQDVWTRVEAARGAHSGGSGA